MKLKLKMREDLSDKEITDISVSSPAFPKNSQCIFRQCSLLERSSHLEVLYTLQSHYSAQYTLNYSLPG